MNKTTSKELKELKELKAEVVRLRAKIGKPLTALISNNEARNIVGVSVRTWHSLRAKKAIPYVRIGRKILYKVEDVNRFIEQHYVK